MPLPLPPLPPLPPHACHRWLHEYQLTPHSLYAAVSIGLETGTILAVLGRLAKNALPREVAHFVRECTQNYGKVCACRGGGAVLCCVFCDCSAMRCRACVGVVWRMRMRMPQHGAACLHMCGSCAREHQTA